MMPAQPISDHSLLIRLYTKTYSSHYGRWGVHAAFWLVLACLTLYSYTWVLKDAPSEAYILVESASFFEIATGYYLFAYVGMPLLYTQKWVKLLLFVVVIYLFFNYTNFFLYNFLNTTYNILEKLTAPYNQYGFWLSPFQRYTFLINWSFTISSFIIPVIVKITKDVLITRARTAELERDNLKLELHFLQSQIQPHFILNSLNSVYSMVACSNDEAATLLLRLSSILRYALHETSHQTVWLSQEVKFLQEYIGLEAVRQHERTTLSFQSEGSLAGYRIPPLLLVTFVENAFKHGINATYQQAWATICLHMRANGQLNFRVENSKPVRHSQQAPVAGSGIGLENTKRRLNILFPGKHKLVVTNAAETFLIDLTIQLTPVAASVPALYPTQDSSIDLNRCNSEPTTV